MDNNIRNIHKADLGLQKRIDCHFICRIQDCWQAATTFQCLARQRKTGIARGIHLLEGQCTQSGEVEGLGARTADADAGGEQA